jgi:hypothetical protein
MFRSQSGSLASEGARDTGPMKQWIRVGPSYSHNLGIQTTSSIRWGASPANKGKYFNQKGVMFRS